MSERSPGIHSGRGGRGRQGEEMPDLTSAAVSTRSIS